MSILHDSFVKNQMALHNVPGLAIGVIKNGNVLLSNGYGYSHINSIPCTSKTQFGMASCSKSFTASLISLLSDRGILDINKPIRSYLPDFEMYDPYASEYCTLRHMLLHRTGLAPHNAVWSDTTVDRAVLLRRLKYLEPVAPFDTVTLYNNTIYTMIGHIAERVTGVSYEEMIKHFFLDPLCMHDTDLDAANFSNRALPYIFKNGKLSQMPVLDCTLGAPCAGIYSCSDDMLKWLYFHICRGKAPDGRHILSRRSMEEMHTGQVPFPLWPWGYSELSEPSYGFAWFSQCYRSLSFIHHTGEIQGYCSVMAFFPGQELGIVILANRHRPCVSMLYTLLFTICDEVLSLGYIDHARRLNMFKDDDITIYHPTYEDLLPDISTIQPCEPFDNSKLSGRYFDPGYGYIDVDGLTLTYRGETYELIKYTANVYFIKDLIEDTVFYDVPVVFSFDEKVSISIKFEKYTSSICFKRICDIPKQR